MRGIVVLLFNCVWVLPRAKPRLGETQIVGWVCALVYAYQRPFNGMTLCVCDIEPYVLHSVGSAYGERSLLGGHHVVAVGVRPTYLWDKRMGAYG